MKYIPTVAMIIIILGSLNWGLIGLGIYMGDQNWNVVEQIFNPWPEMVNLVYIIFGIAGAWALFDWYSKSTKKK